MTSVNAGGAILKMVLANLGPLDPFGLRDSTCEEYSLGIGTRTKPLPPSPEVAARMRAVATRDTGPELRVRKVIRALGLKFTSLTGHLPGKPDLVLPDHKIAVFVHGCFWHGCPRCYVEPKRNRRWWRQKITNNRRRDRRKADQLRRLGYSVITLMEHDSDRRIKARLHRLR